MELITNGVRGQAQCSYSFHAHRKEYRAPALSGKTKMITKTIIDGEQTTKIKVLHYIGVNGSLYVAADYDRMFSPPKMKIKPLKRSSGKSKNDVPVVDKRKDRSVLR